MVRRAAHANNKTGSAFEPIGAVLRQLLAALIISEVRLEVPPAQKPLAEAPNLAATSAASTRARLVAPVAAIAARSPI